MKMTHSQAQDISCSSPTGVGEHSNEPPRPQQKVEADVSFLDVSQRYEQLIVSFILSAKRSESLWTFPRTLVLGTAMLSRDGNSMFSRNA
jgi:hypothetical protein